MFLFSAWTCIYAGGVCGNNYGAQCPLAEHVALTAETWKQVEYQRLAVACTFRSWINYSRCVNTSQAGLSNTCVTAAHTSNNITICSSKLGNMYELKKKTEFSISFTYTAQWIKLLLEKATSWGASWFVLIEKNINKDDQIQADSTGGTCSKHRTFRNAYKILVGKPEGKRPHERPGAERIALKWILRKQELGKWTGLRWLRTGTGRASCEHGNEPSVFHKNGEFSD
jgi:hypothetical protein